jgi:hypothetical protein
MYNIYMDMCTCGRHIQITRTYPVAGGPAPVCVPAVVAEPEYTGLGHRAPLCATAAATAAAAASAAAAAAAACGDAAACVDAACKVEVKLKLKLKSCGVRRWSVQSVYCASGLASSVVVITDIDAQSHAGTL